MRIPGLNFYRQSIELCARIVVVKYFLELSASLRVIPDNLGFWIPSSTTVDAGFQSLAGFRIPTTRIPDSTWIIFFGILNPDYQVHGAKT